jgi:V/A-type H+-transporting ATPase subunit C
MLHRALREAMRREARVHPLSLAVPLCFVLERRAEVQRIRLVLRGAEFGLPADELLALVER